MMNRPPFPSLRYMMNCLAICPLVLAVLLAAWSPNSARADDSYVKVKIKGQLRFPNPNPRVNLAGITVEGVNYEIDVTTYADKLPSQKKLEEMEYKIVVIHGTLVIRRGEGPRIRAMRISIELAPDK